MKILKTEAITQIVDKVTNGTGDTYHDVSFHFHFFFVFDTYSFRYNSSAETGLFPSSAASWSTNRHPSYPPLYPRSLAASGMTR